MNHNFAFAEGVAYRHMLILTPLSAGATLREDRYQVQMLCCGTVTSMSHRQIRKRLSDSPGCRAPETCKFCRQRLAPVPPPASVVVNPRRATWAPGDRLGTVTLVTEQSDSHWLIRWDCCAQEEVLSRYRLHDLLSKTRRGLQPHCRACARTAAVARGGGRRQPVVVASPPPVTTPLLAPGVVSAARAWPRPPGLAALPPVLWGAPL